MQKIITHLWFDKEAKEAIDLYTSLFEDSKITNERTIKDTPGGDADIFSFSLRGQEFMAINAGPIFKFNPSISLSVFFKSEEEIENVWNKLIEGGKALMEYNTYPWAKKYGWVEDKYGLTWQLSYNDENDLSTKIIPSLLFTKEMAGKTKEAIDFYTQVFPHSNTEMVVYYEKDDNDTEGFVKHAEFKLSGQDFIAMDSSLPHEFKFNEAISFIVNCENQEEIDYYWDKLSAQPEAEQCGWLKDKYGLSWQIVPKEMNEMMENGNEEQIRRVTEAFLKMKKFNIDELKKAYEGE